MIKPEINPENIIKSCIAETVVEIMLRKAGYQVYRFGFKWILHNLMLSKEYAYMKDQVDMFGANMPTFLIVKDKIPDFIEVKYRKDGELGKNEIHTWSKGRLILVFPFAPYFKISKIKDFKETGNLYSLEDDKFVQVKKETIDTFTPLVEKYLKGK